MKLKAIVVSDVDERTVYVECDYACGSFEEGMRFYNDMLLIHETTFTMDSPIASSMLAAPVRFDRLQQGDFYVRHQLVVNRNEGAALTELIAGLHRMYNYEGKIRYVKDKRLGNMYIPGGSEHAWVFQHVEIVDAALLDA